MHGATIKIKDCEFTVCSLCLWVADTVWQVFCNTALSADTVNILRGDGELSVAATDAQVKIQRS